MIIKCWWFVFILMNFYYAIGENPLDISGGSCQTVHWVVRHCAWTRDAGLVVHSRLPHLCWWEIGSTVHPCHLLSDPSFASRRHVTACVTVSCDMMHPAFIAEINITACVNYQPLWTVLFKNIFQINDVRGSCIPRDKHKLQHNLYVVWFVLLAAETKSVWHVVKYINIVHWIRLV